MYYYEEINSGWAIFYRDEWNSKTFIAGHLSKKQAIKWTERLTKAYQQGVGSHW